MSLLAALTTFPHFLAVFMSPGPVYSCIVVASTSASILWHLKREPRDWITFIDYCFACSWFVADAYYSIQAGTFVYVTALNVYVVVLKYIAIWLADKHILPYAYGHTIWSILSVIKAFEVTLLLLPVPDSLLDHNFLRGSPYDINISYNYRSLYPL